jgi:hypothetical protein
MYDEPGCRLSIADADSGASNGEGMGFESHGF